MTTTTTLTAAASLTCRRRWRCTICVSIFISSLPKKSSSYHPGVSPTPLPNVVLPSVTVVAEQVTPSRTSSSKSHVAIDIDETEYEELKNTLVPTVQPLPKKSSNLPGESPPPSPSPPSRTSSFANVNIDETEHEELKNTIVRIVQDKDFDSLQAFGDGIEGIASVFGSDLVNGLDGGGREPGELLNITDQAIANKGFFYFLLKSCNSYTIFLLLISSGLCFCIDFIEKGPEIGWHDGVAVLFAVFILVMCPSVANFRRARKLEEKLVNKNNKLDVQVLRGGMYKMVTISNIVEGDIVCLNGGDSVPADGLLVDGDGLVLDEVLAPNVNCDHNPFLLSGSKVINGQGRMLVTSVCPETALSKVLGTVVHDPKERTLLEARIDKPITYTDKVALGISVVISLALLLRLLFGKLDDNDGFPDLKGKVSVEKLMKLLEEILLKPRGKIGILTTSLTAMVIGIQHGMPFVITISISYWNEKMVSDHASLQNLSACGTMGLVTVLCIDVTGGFKWPCQEEFKSTIVALRNSGVIIKLVSADKLFMVRDLACELGLFKPGSNNMMLEGEQFQELNPDQRMEMLDEIQVMANFLPKDKFLMVECLKQRGHVVAFFGGLTTSDTPTLKEADVGITEETHSTEMARENCDIIISDKGCSSLTRVSKTGRCVYHNIQKFIQLQLIASISGILVTFISTVVSGKSPISVIQLVWLNMIMCILGGLMLILKPRTQELTTNQPSSRNEPLITKIMWKVIIAQVLYQAIVLLIFQFKADAIPRVTEKVKDSMIFNSFILCQIFNQLITMDLKKKEPFKAIHYNCCFLVAVGAVAGVHFLMVNFVACLADCVKLNWIQWTISLMIASLSWGFQWTICLMIALLSWGFHWTISFIQEFFTK